MNAYDKAALRKLITIKIRRQRLFTLCYRKQKHFRPGLSDRLWSALRLADLDNEYYNGVCGRRALIACRASEKYRMRARSIALARGQEGA